MPDRRAETILNGLGVEIDGRKRVPNAKFSGARVADHFVQRVAPPKSLGALQIISGITLTVLAVFRASSVAGDSTVNDFNILRTRASFPIARHLTQNLLVANISRNIKSSIGDQISP